MHAPMTAFAPFQVRKPLGVIRGLLALICVCDNVHHAEPTLSLARPYVNRWPARLDTGSLEHELGFNSVQRNQPCPIRHRHAGTVLRDLSGNIGLALMGHTNRERTASFRQDR